MQSGMHNVTLSGVNIQFSNGDLDTSGTAAFKIQGSSAVNLTLKGTNILQKRVSQSGFADAG